MSHSPMDRATKAEVRELYFALMIFPTDERFERIWREMERERIEAEPTKDTAP